MQMRAAIYEAYGGPEVLRVREVPRPEPRPDEVRVAVDASTVTAACGMMRRGDTAMARVVLGLLRPRRRFRVLGTEIAGVVDAVGARVRRFQPGCRVYGFTGMHVGGCAEYVTLREDASLVAAPAGLTPQEACTLVDGPTTALYFLRDRGALRAGERVAILGASGSVGTAAVQIARHLGAEVTAICSGANAALVSDLGAHHVIDYTAQDYTDAGARYDVVFDTVGKSSFAAAKRALQPGGRYLVTVGGPWLPVRAWLSRFHGDHRLVFGFSIEKTAALQEVTRLVAQGALRPVIDRRYALADIAEAHRYVDTGRKRGNVVIAIREG